MAPTFGPKSMKKRFQIAKKGARISCTICLTKMDKRADKAFPISCYHMFCFPCINRWSKEKSECPLCKEPFTHIVHRFRSGSDYSTRRIPEGKLPHSLELIDSPESQRRVRSQELRLLTNSLFNMLDFLVHDLHVDYQDSDHSRQLRELVRLRMSDSQEAPGAEE